MTDKAQQFWDKNAKQFDENEKFSDAVYKDILEKTAKYLDPDDQVLDFGCATGTKTIELASKVKHIRGLDFSTEMIRIANIKKDESKVPNASFSQGTIYSKDFEPASFDKITSYAVIHLLKDKEKAIQRINELLKPGGFFISVTPCFKENMTFKNRMHFISIGLKRRLGLFPLHLNMFKTKDVTKLIADQHFSIIETDALFDGISISFVVAKKI